MAIDIDINTDIIACDDLVVGDEFEVAQRVFALLSDEDYPTEKDPQGVDRYATIDVQQVTLRFARRRVERGPRGRPDLLRMSYSFVRGVVRLVRVIEASREAV